MVSINFSKRDLRWIVPLVLVLVIGFGIAYGGSEPSVMGHSAEEIEGVCLSDGTNCPASLGGGLVFGNSEAKNFAQAYGPVSSDGFVVASTNWAYLDFYLGTSVATLSIISKEAPASQGPQPSWGSITWPVKKGQFWKVDGSSDSTPFIYWIPLISGTSTSLSSEEIRLWQNMGPSHTQDSRIHASSCDSGYLMSGLRAWASSYVEGYMTSHCTESSLTLSGTTTKGPLGNLDSQFHNLECNDDQVIRSVSFYCTAYWDYSMQLTCGTLVGATLDNTNPVWALNLYGGVNNDQYTSTTGSVYDSETITADCPAGYVATGIRAWAGSYIENFDIKCKKII